MGVNMQQPQIIIQTAFIHARHPRTNHAIIDQPHFP